jgi:hypothetical protein
MRVRLLNWAMYTLVMIVWVAYLVLSLKEPLADTAQQLGVSLMVVSVLRIAVAVPFLATWMLAAVGWANLRRYAGSQERSAEAAGFKWITRGLLVLLAGFMASTLMESVTALLRFHAQIAAIARINQYTSVVFPLIGFLLIFIGTGRLIKSANIKSHTLGSLWYGILPPLLFGLFYLVLIFIHPRQAPIAGLAPSSYLPASLIIITVVIPVVAGWGLGLLSALRIEGYTHYVSEKNKPIMATFYSGLLAVLAGSIVGQALASLGRDRLLGLGLVLLLGLIYLYLAILSLGYWLIAASSRSMLASFRRNS